MKKILLIPIIFSAVSFSAQEDSTKRTIDSLKMEINSLKEMITLRQEEEKPKEKKWYEKISFNGYIQMRYNSFLSSNGNIKCEQCDSSLGEVGGFTFRRVRVSFFGQITPRVYFYFQPDFSKTIEGKNYVGSINDAYFDIGLNSKNEYRIRLGQSKVPYGYGNLQSSSDRIPLDRDDAIDSALKDERDMGMYFMWTGKKQKEIIDQLTKDDLKHSKDFGVFALGLYNGQTGNKFDANKKFHWITRFSYPFRVNNQVIETSLQAYMGKFVLPNVSQGTKVDFDKEYIDKRIAASFILYPQPFGIQAEYNIGKGPEYDDATHSVKTKTLYGGYAMLTYFIKKWKQTFIPFARFQHYQGGKKHELDARSYNVKEYEVGVEWHPIKSFELTAICTYSNRRYSDFVTPNYYEKGGLVRLQAQLRF